MELSENTKKVAILGSVGAATVLFVALLFIVIFQIAAIGPLRRERANAQARLAYLQQEIDDNRTLNEHMSTREFIEEYARDEMGLGKSGTIKYTFR